MEIIGDNSSTAKYKLFVILQCMIWGMGYPITRYIYLSMSPLCYMAVRFALGALFFVAVFHNHIAKDLESDKIKKCALVGFFMGGSYIFGNISVGETMVTIAGFLMGTPVIFTVLFSIIFMKRRPGIKFYVILVIVLIGMYLVCCGGTGVPTFGKGELFALLSAACLGINSILSAKYIKEVTPFTLSAVQCAVTSVLCIIFGSFLEDFSCIFNALPISWAAFMYQLLGSTVAAFLLQNVSIRHLSPMFVSLVFCIEPVFTAVASSMILGERMTGIGIIGSVLIMFGVIAASLMKDSGENRTELKE